MNDKKPVKLILCGLGNVGKAFMKLLAEKQGLIRQGYGLNLQLSAVMDSCGAIVDNGKGIPVPELLQHLESGRKAQEFAAGNAWKKTGLELIGTGYFSVLVDTTPTNLIDGGAALEYMREAFKQKMDVITANKGPLVLHYGALQRQAASTGCKIGISAATAAALPTLDVGLVSLCGSTILSIEGILNGTTNYILSKMEADGTSYQTALDNARNLGIAETDPALDVEGWDTANKIILITNRIFGTEYGPDHISVQGITHVTCEEVKEARRSQRVIKLVGTIDNTHGIPSMNVAPKILDENHPLAQVNGAEKGISYLSDTLGRITLTGGESSPLGAAAALLKDLVNIHRPCC